MSDNINLPKFIFVGTAKAGTTSVYKYLMQHPNINIPVKETFFFMKDIYKNITLPYPKQRSDEPLIHNESDYFNIYKNQPGITGEIGTGYLYYHQYSIPLIKKYLGDDVKILILLRNPVDRCFSSYKHFTKDLFETNIFTQALSIENQRISENWDFMWHYKNVGLYYEQVKAFLQHFKNVKIILYDDLISQPQKTMHEIISFIGIKEPFTFSIEKAYNESGTPKNKSIHKLLVHDHWIKKYITRPIIKTILPYKTRDKIRKYLRNKNFKKSTEKINPEDKKYLQQYYAQDLEKLSALIGVDLKNWLI